MPTVILCEKYAAAMSLVVSTTAAFLINRKRRKLNADSFGFRWGYFLACFNICWGLSIAIALVMWFQIEAPQIGMLIGCAMRVVFGAFTLLRKRWAWIAISIVGFAGFGSPFFVLSPIGLFLGGTILFFNWRYGKKRWEELS